MDLACPDCGGSGKSGRTSSYGDRCWRCHGRGRVPEPRVNNASLRRWIKVAHVLAQRPGLTAADVDDRLGNAYGRASVTGILGAMRSAGVVGKDADGRWRLSDGGFAWQQLFCRHCLWRAPRHKSQRCPAPSPITTLGLVPEQEALGTSALAASLAGSLGQLPELESPYTLAVDDGRVALVVSRPLFADEARALAESLAVLAQAL